MSEELKDKVALVTGGSRGIGRAILAELGRQGATVIGTATSSDGADGIRSYLAQNGFEGDGIVMDVTDPQGVEEGIKAVSEKHGAPSILVNNAGVTRDGLMMRMKADDWDDVISANLSAAYRTSKAVMRGMMKGRWGRIINLSSVVARLGNAGQANYAASKSGLEGFTRSLASELGSRNITVNAVAPGFVETDMTAELDEKQRDAMLAAIPLGRLAQPEEIAALVGFLASEKSSYITGETIQINGGMYMN